MTVIRTKLRPPQLAAPLVSRPHLIHLFAGLAEPLVVIAAPAGFGKTSLLGQWWSDPAQAAQTRAWLTLDKADNDPHRFFLHVVSAIREAVPDFGGGLLKSIQADQNFAAAAGGDALVDQLVGSAEPITLVFDDLHEIEKPELLDWVRRLVDSVSRGCRIFVATRDSGPLRLSRFRASGRLIEIGARDLALSPEEARRHLDAVGCPPMTVDSLESLYRKTEGWAAGLHLASLSLRHIGSREAERFVASFSGSHRDLIDYLGEEVLSALPDDVRDFLLKTSVLDRLSAGLCNAVAGRDDSGRLLERLARSGHFLVPLDSDQCWYRYHQLFSEFLQRILLREGRCSPAALHGAASRWLAEEGLTEEALDHAFQAADNEYAAQILDDRCGDLLRFGRTGRLLQALERIPPAIRARYPRLQLSYAWVLAVYWDFEHAEQIVKGLRTHSPRSSTVDDAVPRLERDLLHKEIMLALMTDDANAANRLVVHWRPREDASHDPYAEASVEVTRIYARGQRFDFANLETFAERVRALMSEAGSDSGRVWADSIIGPIQALAGDFARARETYIEAIRRGLRVGGRRSFLVAMPSFLLAEVEYQSGHLARARALVARHLNESQHAGFVESFVVGCIQHARLLASEGECADALDFLDRIHRDSVPGHFSRLRARLSLERLNLSIRSGQHRRLNQIARESGLAADATRFLPSSGATVENVVLGLAWARLALAECRHGEAIRCLRQWMTFLDRKNGVQFFVPTAILLAIACELAGDSGGAQRAIRPAILCAAKSGMIQPFVDEGARILRIAERFHKAAENAGDPVASFSGTVLDRLHGGANHDDNAMSALGWEAGTIGAVEPLTQREAEIIQLIGKGLTNREVGKFLGVSSETVKWHLKQVYPKLGVQRRYRAVSEARRMGLIP